MIKRITLLVVLIAVVLTAKAQFGSYSHDLPFMGADSGSAAEPISVNIYEYFSFNTNSITNNYAYGAFGRETIYTPSPAYFPALTTGVSDGGLLFNAADAQVLNWYNTNTAYPITLYGTNSWSVSLWLDIDRESTNISTTPFCTGDTIASLWRNAANYYQAWRLGYSVEDSGLAFRVKQNYSQWVKLDIFPIGSQMTNGWFHLAFGYDGSIPGIWFQTNAGPRQVRYVTNALAPFFVEASHPISFGNVGDGSRGYVGKMDELGFWERAISTNEVTQLYGYQTNALVYNANWSDQFVSNNPAPALFDPKTIPDLIYGVDALRPYTLVNTSRQTSPAHGQSITNWHNIVTNTIVFAANIASLPIYYTNGAGTNGDKPRLSFASSAALKSVITSSPGATTNTYVIVHDATPVTTPGGRLLSAIVDSQGVIASANDGGNAWYAYSGGWVGPFRHYKTNFTVTTILGVPSRWSIRTNGVVMETNAAANNSGMNVGLIGCTYESGYKYFWNANISRIYRWGRALTTNELQQVEDACRREYGI